MKISDFADMEKFEQIMSNWAKATGLATVAVGDDGSYISDCYNFTEFCINLTRGSAEGCRRCEKCDREGVGVYHCHAGLIDFGIPLIIEGQQVGSVIGGQVLPESPDEEEFRAVAREIGVDEDEYIRALGKVTVKTEEAIKASADLLGEVINNFINAEYARNKNAGMIHDLTEGVAEIKSLVSNTEEIITKLKAAQNKQAILALNARIEAARAGEFGKGFAVVADEVATIANINKDISINIEKNVKQIVSIANTMHID